MHGSAPLRLGNADWRKIGKGLGIALGGAGLGYLGQEVIPTLNMVGMGWLAPLGAVLINAGVKFLSDTRG